MDHSSCCMQSPSCATGQVTDDELLQYDAALFRRQILAPAWGIDCGGARTEARRPGAIIQVSSHGSWEGSGGHRGSEKLGRGVVLGVF